MTVQTDDVTLRGKLDLSGVDRKQPSRKGGDAGPRGPGRKKRELGPEKKTPTGPQRKGGIDGRGIGKDILQRRTPGLSRFGGAGAKVAGMLGLLYAVDLAGPALAAFSTEATPPLSFASEDVRRAAREEAINIWNKSAGLIIDGIGAALKGGAQTTEDIGALLAAAALFLLGLS